MFLLSPEINWVFFGDRQQPNARAGQKKTHVFYCNALPRSKCARSSKTEEKHSGLEGRGVIVRVWCFAITAGCRARSKTA